MCFLIFSTIFCETFLILRRTEREVLKTIYWSSSKAPFVPVRSNETWFYSFFFEKYWNIEFHENPSDGSRVVPCGRTDMTKLIVGFRNFANVPQNNPNDKFPLFLYDTVAPVHRREKQPDRRSDLASGRVQISARRLAILTDSLREFPRSFLESHGKGLKWTTTVFLYLQLFDILCICYLQLGWHPVAAVQYTFTHKQYTEQHSETECTERNIHNNKNT